MRLVVGFCLLAAFVARGDCNTVDPATAQRVQAALDQAFDNIVSRSRNERTITDKGNIILQRANNESRNLQFTGDLLQETTTILVARHGAAILPAANQIITKMMKESTNQLGGRTKRQTTQCRGPPQNCNDVFHTRFRATTGICNNINRRTPGSAITAMRSLIPPFYDDGINSVRNMSATGRGTIPSARLVSNALHQQSAVLYDGITNHLHMQFGQFMAHDVIFMPSATGMNGENLDCSSCDSGSTVSPNCAPIPVPANDSYFRPQFGEPRCLRLTRALNGQQGLGVRTQVNQNTHFLDLSTVYGSSDCEAVAVREFRDGRLAEFTGRGYVLPPQVNDTNCQSRAPFFCFTCGDFRNSLHPGLVPVHVAFIKEHNRIAANLRNQGFSDRSDEGLYQAARRIVIGMYQHFVYNEYLPKLLGNAAMTEFNLRPGQPGSPPFRGYSVNSDPALTNEFASTAFRFGHSQIRRDIPRVNSFNQTMGAAIDLGNNIFYADSQYQATQGGSESMLQGMVNSASQRVGLAVSFPVRNQMFELRGQPGSGVDLIAVNIMRGRDVGVNPYVRYRTIAGLRQANNFDDLSGQMTTANINAFRSVYADVRDIDLFPAMLSETPVQGGLIGPTGAFILAEQFRALKTGDRFYYENQVPGTVGFNQAQIDAIRRTTMGKFLCANTALMVSAHTDAFNQFVANFFFL